MTTMRTMMDGWTLGATTGRITARWLGGLRTRTAVAIVLSLVYGSILLLSIVTWLSPPGFSLTLTVPDTGSARIEWVLPGGSLWERGVRPGDLVLSLDGRRPSPLDEGRWTGESVTIRRAMGGMVELHATSVYRGRVAWPLLALSPWFFLFGTLVFLREPRRSVAWATYALFVSAAFALGLAPATIQSRPLAAAVEYAFITMFPLCFLLFFLSFPVHRGSGPLRTLLAAPTVTVALLNVASVWWPTVYDPATLLTFLLLTVYLVAGSALAVHSFVTTDEPTTRRGLALMASGTVVSVLPFVGLYLLPVLLIRSPLLAAEYAILPLAILPASFAYAILRHHVLHIPLLQRWLVQALVWLGLLAPFVAAMYALRWVLEALPWSSYVLPIEPVLVLLAAIAFVQLRAPLRRLLDRLVFKDSYDYRASLQSLSRDLSIASDLDVLATSLPNTLRQLMNLDFAVLLVHEAGRSRVRGPCGHCPPDLLPALVESARRVQGGPTVLSLAYGYLDVLFVPLRVHDTVVGHLCLGPKASREPFRADDRDLLTTLSGHLAAAVRNAQLVNELSEKVFALDALNERLESAQEEERARLSAEIHDEPLQRLIQLQRHLAEAGERDGAEKEKDALGQVVDQLRAVCAAMRPSTLDDLGLHGALEDLASERSSRSGVPIAVDVAPEAVGADLPRESELALYRAAQEAINNSLRHARPHAIRVTLRLKGDLIQLAVTDDGAGFDVPCSLTSLVGAGHLGLASLRARVRRMGGQLIVSSTPGEGTVLRVELPLSAVAP